MQLLGGGALPPLSTMTHWREARAGISAGILAAIQSLTHGVIAFGALGALGASFGMASALAASAAFGLCVAFMGSSRPLIGTTTGAAALVTGATIVSAGAADIGAAVATAMLLAGLAGLFLLALSVTGLAQLAALVPTPVTQGLANATVVLIVISQAPLLLGGQPGAGWPEPHLPAIAVASLAVLLMLYPLPRIPAPLTALMAATGLHHGLAWLGFSVGPEVGLAPSPKIILEGVEAGWRGLAAAPSVVLLLPAAATIALLATIETLAAATALREQTGRRTDYSRDLRGVSAGLLMAPAVGGMPGSGLTTPSLFCWAAGGRGRAAQIWRAMVSLALLLGAGALLSMLPFAALAGILCGAVLRLVEWPLSPFLERAGRFRRVGDMLVVVAVVLSAAIWGLVFAVGVGVLLSVIIFTVSMAQAPIRRVSRNPVGRSRIRRPEEQERRLRAVGESIALMELEGAIFFGSADGILQRVTAEHEAGARIIILDLSRVTRLDLSGGRRIIELCRADAPQILLCPISADSRILNELEAIGLAKTLPAHCAFSDLASAVEAAEAQLLAETAPVDTEILPDAGAVLHALGLSHDVVGKLLSMCTETSHAPHSLVLRAGDPSDAAYVLLSGEVLISLPAANGRPPVRLGVLVPGTLFGESALLGKTKRGADVTARTAVRCLRIDAATLEHLRLAAPNVAFDLMAMVARQLSVQVRAATATIDRLES